MLPPDLAWELPGELFGLYARIRYRDRGDGCWAGLNDLKGPLSVQQTRRNVRELERRGLIRREPRHGMPAIIRCLTPDTSGTPTADVTPTTQVRGPLPLVSEAPAIHERGPLPLVSPEVDPVNRSRSTSRIDPPRDLFGEPPAPKTRKPRTPKAVEAVELPDWLPVHLWGAWMAFRSKGRAPYTPHAQRLTLGRLEGFRAQGQDPVAVLEQSIERGWTGLFEVKAAASAHARARGPVKNPPSARPDQGDVDIDRLLEEKL